MTYSEIYEKAKIASIKAQENVVLENNLGVVFAPGHTWAVSELDKCHSIIQTAAYYSSLKAADALDGEKAEAILEAIAKHQVKGTGTRQDGNFLWYTEETVIQDYNAAFFICGKFLELLLLCPEKLSEKEKALILQMLECSLTWFDLYCKTAELYYPNSVLSNIYCLYCISLVTGNKEYLENAHVVLDKYFSYTDKRGWGWGENLSPNYIMEIICPLKMISLFAKKHGEHEIGEKAEKYVKSLLRWHAFQGDMEPAPAIRNYNTRGDWTQPRQTKLITGVTNDPDESALPLRNVMLFKDEIEKNEKNRKACEALWAQKTLVEHIFDNAYSTTYRGENVHLGTINEYPFMHTAMQNPTWGNGWQALPVVFTVRGEQMAYLRYEVTTNGRRRCFPHEMRHQPNDVNASLFNEHYYPDMSTVCAQNENLALVLRRVSGLHNSASEIVDEFAVANFEGISKVYTVNGIDFAVLEYQNTNVTVILGALQGITLHKAGEAFPQPETTSVLGEDHDTEIAGLERDGARCPQKLTIDKIMAKQVTWEKKTMPVLTVSQTMYKGDERRLDYRALETSWLVITLDRKLDNVEEYLKSIKIELDSVHDFEEPRWQDCRIYKATVEAEGKKLTLTYDPYTRKMMY